MTYFWEESFSNEPFSGSHHFSDEHVSEHAQSARPEAKTTP